MLAQQEHNNFIRKKNIASNDIGFREYFISNQNNGKVRPGDLDLIVPTMPTSETVVKVDSVFYTDEDGIFKDIFTYDYSQNLLAHSIQVLENEEWINHRTHTYDYDTDGNLLKMLYQKWGDESWYDFRRFNYTYNSNGDELTYLMEELYGNGWFPITQILGAYDDNGFLINELWQHYNFETELWEDTRLVSYTNNMNGLMMEWLDQAWVDGEWKNNIKRSWSYDMAGNMVTESESMWMDGNWKEFRLETFTYDESGNVLSQISDYWVEDMLELHYAYYSTYNNNNNPLTLLYQEWENETWENVYIISCYYDANEDKHLELKQVWGDGAWENHRKVEYGFFYEHVHARAYYWHNNLWKEQIQDTQLQITIGGTYVDPYYAYILDLYYTDVTGIEEQDVPLENEIIYCYPNPVTDVINININPEWQTDDFMIELFNQSGQAVKSVEITSIASTTSLHVDDVPPGLYLLKFSNDRSVAVQKVIISK